VKHAGVEELVGDDFVIRAEKYGIPQTRHRVILLGVRRDLKLPSHNLIQQVTQQFTVHDAIGDLPPIRSKLSVSGETTGQWHRATSNAPERLLTWIDKDKQEIVRRMEAAAKKSKKYMTAGERFINSENVGPNALGFVKRWFSSDNPGGVLQHESRSHMELDLCRYMFAATYAERNGVSPKLDRFPPSLLPQHKNALEISDGVKAPFMDRFRVQCADGPSTTVVSHIAKDGHYYIHYDPSQCRSLTVREAARLQTFPDNYFFEGNRTQQYTQVGNAVPPLLAYKLAIVVRDLFYILRRHTENEVMKIEAYKKERLQPFVNKKKRCYLI
jgi:DNA (cytosine-5)-methyltransferase 1